MATVTVTILRAGAGASGATLYGIYGAASGVDTFWGTADGSGVIAKTVGSTFKAITVLAVEYADGVMGGGESGRLVKAGDTFTLGELI